LNQLLRGRKRMTIKFLKRNAMILVSVILFFSLSDTQFLFAGSTGKIAGKIVDAKTGEPLIGANIIIVGTQLGASSDVSGRYYIIGVPAGTYSLKASYIGYQPLVMTQVVVTLDHTTELNIKLEPSNVQLGKEVVVVAKREAIQLDVSSSKQDINLSNVNNAPLQDFNDMLNLQPGVIFQNTSNDVSEQMTPTLTIRGGTSVGVFVDGMNVTEGIYSGSITNFNLSELKAAEILTGGFSAEYGNIRSGVINVVTKEGESQYHASLDYKVSPSHLKHFGPNIYDPQFAPEWQLYGTNAALYGPDGKHDPNNPDSYWELFSKFDTVYHFTPEQAQKVWEWQHRARNYGNKPDYIIDGSLGGPLPVLGQLDIINNLNFFSSIRYEYNMLAIPLSRDHYTDLNWFWKLTYHPIGSLKINVQGNYQENFSSVAYNTPEVSISTPIQAVYCLQYYGTKYYDGQQSVADRYRNQIGFSLNHILSRSTYYDLRVNYLLRRSFVYPMPYTGGPTLTINGFTFDASPQQGWIATPTERDFGNRESDFGLSTQGYFFTMGGQGKQRDFSREGLLTSRLDLVSQLNDFHQLKTGLQFTYDDLNENDGIVQYSPPLVKMNLFHVIPLIASYYAEDKIEFQGMIANLGVRFDYTNRRTSYFSNIYSSDFNTDSINVAEKSKVRPFFYISPRIGISHPISTKSKLFFNYGHFYSEPNVDMLYSLRQRETGVYDIIPNSDLKPERTIAYELGFEQQFGNYYLFHISAYYRDITSQIKSVQYVSNAGNIVTSYTNDNYADVRGFEAIFEKNIGDFITGSLSYDYYVMSSGNVGYDIVYQNVLQTSQATTSNLSTPGANYTLLANVTFSSPKDWGPRIYGEQIFSDWRLNITHELRSGETFTWNPNNLPGVQNNVRWRDYQHTNLRLSKNFTVRGVGFEAYMEVINVFNRKELTHYLRSLLLPNLKDWENYMNSLRPGDRPGDYKQSYIVLPPAGDFPTQLLFLNPRSYYFGIRLSF